MRPKCKNVRGFFWVSGEGKTWEKYGEIGRGEKRRGERGDPRYCFLNQVCWVISCTPDAGCGFVVCQNVDLYFTWVLLSLIPTGLWINLSLIMYRISTSSEYGCHYCTDRGPMMMSRLVWHASSLILLMLPHGRAALGVQVLKIEISVSVSCFGAGRLGRVRENEKGKEKKKKEKKTNFPHGTQFLVSPDPLSPTPTGRTRSTTYAHHKSSPF